MTTISTTPTALLADEHAELLLGVQRRASAVRALISGRTWPHGELATLTGFLRGSLMRQVSDEEQVLYPPDSTEAPFSALGAGHAHLYELTEQLEEVRERGCSLPRLGELLDELLRTLRAHLAEEQAVLSALSAAEPVVPAAAALTGRHEHWPPVGAEGPVVISLDDLPAAAARQVCLERLLRLRPGQQAVVHADDPGRLRDVQDWLAAFDPERYACATLSDRPGTVRLQVSRRDPC